MWVWFFFTAIAEYSYFFIFSLFHQFLEKTPIFERFSTLHPVFYHKQQLKYTPAFLTR
jgi:hypothetical protein